MVTVKAPESPGRGPYSEECIEAAARWQGISAKPDSESRRQREGIRIFRNPVLETGLTKAPPVLPWIWSVPLIVFGLYRGIFTGRAGLAATLGLFVAGILLWTLIEYLLHRFLFHFRPKGDRVKMFFFLAHGYHHEFPGDRMRLVAPPLMFVTLALIFGVLYRVAFGGSYWAQLFAGTVTGYLGYDCVHYYTHHATPRSRVGKYLRSYHLLHHFQDSDNRYGISTPLWDLVFGTFRGLGRR